VPQLTFDLASVLLLATTPYYILLAEDSWFLLHRVAQNFMSKQWTLQHKENFFFFSSSPLFDYCHTKTKENRKDESQRISIPYDNYQSRMHTPHTRSYSLIDRGAQVQSQICEDV
jgi:hypothetical protein